MNHGYCFVEQKVSLFSVHGTTLTISIYHSIHQLMSKNVQYLAENNFALRQIKRNSTHLSFNHATIQTKSYILSNYKKPHQNHFSKNKMKKYNGKINVNNDLLFHTQIILDAWNFTRSNDYFICSFSVFVFINVNYFQRSSSLIEQMLDDGCIAYLKATKPLIMSFATRPFN